MTETDLSLCQPFGQGSPAGRNLRNPGEGQAEYRQLRDARSQARAAERQHDMSAAEDRMPGIAPEWTDVRRLARDILSSFSKDLEVAVWLVEAETRLNGYDGLARAVTVVNNLVRDFGRNLHPQPEEPDDEPFAILAGLNGIGREGTLVQPLRLLSLVPGMGYGHLSLWDVESAAGSESVRAEMIEAGPDAMQTRHDEVQSAIDALDGCDRTCTELMGTDAPPFTLLISVLKDAQRAIRMLAGIDESSNDIVEIAAATNAVSGADSPVPSDNTSPVPMTRERALDELLRIAAYFRKTEPHSPISASLETLVRRGRMDFVTLLKELIPDDSARAALMTTAGIREKPRDDDDPGGH
ncbi:MAG: type VI secretion system protein TssA [Pseudorhodobacter sp.]